ncbi:MAG: DUF2275 domain-containing protein [Nitrospirota bacterium]|jgi:hypothetical protein
MNCNDIRNRLSDYLDGEASAEERKAVEEHIEGCPACRRELSELARTLTHLRSLSEVEPPPFFTQRVMRRVTEEAEPKRKILRMLFFPLHVKLPVEAVAVALVAIAAVYIFNATRPEVEMKLASKPAVETPAPPAMDEFASPRDEGREFKRRPSRVKHKTEGARALRKSEESSSGAKEPALRETEGPEAVSPGEEGAPPEGRTGVGREVAPGALHNAPKEEAFVLDKDAEVEITVLVSDLAEARAKCEDAVRKAGGKLLEDETVEAASVVAEIPSARITELVKELGALGEVSVGSHSAAGDNVRVRIRLQAKP